MRVKADDGSVHYILSKSLHVNNNGPYVTLVDDGADGTIDDVELLDLDQFASKGYDDASLWL